MKKITVIGMATLMLGIGTLSTGCFGNFALTRKVYTWNDSLGNKFVKTFVFWGLNIIPVYGFCGFIDAIILNLIEFWTGSNPLAMKSGEKEQQIVKGKDGNKYEITATQNRFDIITVSGKNKGSKQALVFNPANKSWNIEKDGVSSTIACIHEDINKVEVFGVDGSVKMVDMNQLELDRVINGQ